MNLFLVLLSSLSLCNLGASESHEIPSFLPSSSTIANKGDQDVRTVIQKASERALYFTAGSVLGSVSLLARLGWGISLISPLTSTFGNECLLISHVCDCVAGRAFAQMFKNAPFPSFFRSIPPSHHSWFLNKSLLSQIPSFSDEEKELLRFLEQRWLAKHTGFYASMVDWLCPCFDICVQVHPDTSSSYARNPGIKISDTYKKKVKEWKQFLPHPQSFPLILTRPSNLHDFLPSNFHVPKSEKIEATVERLTKKMEENESKITIDLTHIFPEDRNKWLETWNDYRVRFTQGCIGGNIHLNRILCIQRLQDGYLGGIRILPFGISSPEEIQNNHQFLLHRISILGLSANRVELDRGTLLQEDFIPQKANASMSVNSLSKEEFISSLHAFEQNWKSAQPHKTLLVKGILQVLKGLFAALSEDKWREISNNITRSSAAQLCFLQIKEQLQLLSQEPDENPFYETSSHVEQIHSSLSALLEIFSPFNPKDFPSIYRDLLTTIPENLKSLSSLALHASGMTSTAGILKATESFIGKTPRVLYGENTYFENIHAFEMVSNASSLEEAKPKELEEADIVFVQFNPVVRPKFDTLEYRVEKIADMLHKCLNARHGKPLVIALDCTFDYINSYRAGDLLVEFQKEIETGTLNFICYRSGLKFDLFGMDNYCGAPFVMIHNQDEKWACFDSLVTDPVLQTDRLSFNWFCLAYKNAAPELEQYRKQIFDNTRALLDKIPARLLKNRQADYHVVPVEKGADLTFIDIKIYGPFHQVRAGLIGGFFSVESMEKGTPIFYRPSLGFYHSNFIILFEEKCSTLRLTLGLDPSEIDMLAKSFETVDGLNSSSWQGFARQIALKQPVLKQEKQISVSVR